MGLGDCRLTWRSIWTEQRSFFQRARANEHEKYYHEIDDKYEDYVDHFNTTVKSANVSIAGLVLFSICGPMGFILFFVGWRSSSGGVLRHVVL